MKLKSVYLAIALLTKQSPARARKTFTRRTLSLLS